jgi:hypothetical protein
MIKQTLFTLALVASAGAAYAQGEPADPYGRPLIGREDWVRQPGDQPGVKAGMGQQPMSQQSTRPAPMASAPMNSDMAAAPVPMAPMASSPSVAGEPRDPYGRPLIGRNDWVRQPGDQPGPTR